MARKSTADLQKAKEAKQKRIAIVGCVLLLAILGFQGPRTLKMLKGPEAAPQPPPATTVAAPTNGGLALPPVTGGTAAPTPAPTGAATSDSGPAPVAGQLVSFTRFASKDPFVQQIDPGATDAPTGSGGSSGSSGGGKAGSSGAKSSGSVGSKSDASTGGGSKSDAPTKATLVVNGVREEVAVGGEFPKSGPFFLLVAVGPSSARVGIAGGSYASGEQTATVRTGKTLVLQNTADGTRYEIRLVGTA